MKIKIQWWQLVPALFSGILIAVLAAVFGPLAALLGIGIWIGGFAYMFELSYQVYGRGRELDDEDPADSCVWGRDDE